MREKIVENFRERMQLRRSLIELEDQNVQNSIEVRQTSRSTFVVNGVCTHMSEKVTVVWYSTCVHLRTEWYFIYIVF